MRRLRSLFSLFLAGFLALESPAQSQKSPEEVLREHFRRGDFELAAFEGNRLAQQKGASLETQALYVSAASSPTFQWFRWPVASILEEMKRRAPEDPWTLLAQSSAESTSAGRISVCDRAIAKSTSIDILAICGEKIANTISTDSVGLVGDESAVKTFIEKHRERMQSTSYGATVLALLELRLTNLAEKEGPRPRDHIYELLDAALAKDPDNERALMIKAQTMLSQRRSRDVIELLGPIIGNKRSSFLHRPYLNSLHQSDLPDDEKARLMEEDIVRLVRNRDPGPLLTVDLLNFVSIYSQEGVRRVAAVVLERHPKSQTAEAVTVRLMELRRGSYTEVFDIPADIRSVAAEEALRFLQDTSNVNPRAISGANGVLRQALLSSEHPDTTKLYSAFKVASEADGYRFVRPLLDRKLFAREVRGHCRLMIDNLVAAARERAIEWRTLSVGRFVESDHWYNLAAWYGALGYAELQLGRITEAEANLRTAARLAPEFAKDVEYLLYAGSAAQAKRDFTTAEEHFNSALATNWWLTKEHPAIRSLRGLYLAKNRTKKGVEIYIADVREKDRVRRRMSVLASRSQSPKAITPFSLHTLDGKTTSSSELVGKIAIVNFWGTWCPPCVKEMPVLQNAYQKYKDDPRVALITINSGDHLGLIKSFVTKNRYSMPILLEGEYVRKIGIDTFPTTWFLDRDGRIAFTKVGPMDEFDIEWRLQSLLQASGQPAK